MLWNHEHTQACTASPPTIDVDYVIAAHNTTNITSIRWATGQDAMQGDEWVLLDRNKPIV